MLAFPNYNTPPLIVCLKGKQCLSSRVTLALFHVDTQDKYDRCSRDHRRHLQAPQWAGYSRVGGLCWASDVI